MSPLLLAAVLACALSAEIDPSLTEWTLIRNGFTVLPHFPIRDYILELKVARPEGADPDPIYRPSWYTDKSTTMIVELKNRGATVGRLIWNSIKYVRGYDAFIEQCHNNYRAYPSEPCGGRSEQIWAWNFTPEDVTLTCDGVEQYRQVITESMPHLEAQCTAMASAPVNQVVLRFLEGHYYRAAPKTEPTEPLPEPTKFPPAEVTETKPPDDVTTEGDNVVFTDPPDETEEGEEYPTCDCWTAECDYCSNMECAVKYDLINNDQGIGVRSVVKRKLSSIVLYDEDGEKIGTFQWNKKGILLSGCITCRTPRALREAVDPEARSFWVLSFKDGVLQIKIGGEVLFEHKLRGECKEAYSKTKSFAFYDMECVNSFKVSGDMETGKRVTADCAGTCDVLE